MSMRVALESFRPHWEAIMRIAEVRFRSEAKPDSRIDTLHGAMNGHFDRVGFLVWANITLNEYKNLRRYFSEDHPVETIDYDLCDRLMTAAGMQDRLPSLYVTKRAPRGRARSSS